MLAAQLYVMNFWKLLCEDDSYMEGGGGIRIIVEMLLFAWTLKFESPCQNLTLMINLNMFFSKWLKFETDFIFCYAFSCLYKALAHDQAQITFRESRNVTHHSRITDKNGRENGLFFLALISLSPLAILPPLIQTIMDMCFALTFRQTDRHIFISQGTLWRIF